MAGTVALIHDLGRPERFLNMLRVIKPTSPLSIGSWILSPFAALASAAAASELTGIAPWLGRLAGWGAAVFGPPLASYTGVLLADTAVPAWHEAHGELPVLFAASGAAAGAGAQLVITGLTGAGGTSACRWCGSPWPGPRPSSPWASSWSGGSSRPRWRRRRLPHGQGGAVEPLGPRPHGGRMGGSLLAALGGRGGRAAAVASGTALAAGSLATRFAVFEAGLASAADPQHVVAPQRERKDRGEQAHHEGNWLTETDAGEALPRT